jgi:tetratricopeptide (TPR) repeat protein
MLRITLATLITLVSVSLCCGQTAEDYFRKGNEKSRLNDYQGAIAYYNKSIELDPNVAEPYFNRGVNKQNLEDYRGAIADYNKVIELDPEYAEAYHNRGLNKLSLSQIDGGCLDLSKAGELGYGRAYDSIRKWCK